jgi:lipid-A-disaccharide synthase
LGESPARVAQLEAYAQVRARVAAAGRHPSARAASIVLDYAERGRGGAAREG